MDCPICTLPMMPHVDREVEIDICPRAHVFFDKHELGEHAARGPRREAELRAAAAGVEPGGRRCPRCAAAMIPLQHRSTRAELCTGCEGVVLWSSSIRAPAAAAGVVAAASLADAGAWGVGEVVAEGAVEVVFALLTGLLDP